MELLRGRTGALLVTLILLASASPHLLPDGDAAECEPICNDCHYTHIAEYHAYLDIAAFEFPPTLDGAELKQVKVTLHLHGNIGLGYTTISRGWLDLRSDQDRVAIDKPKQDFISFTPGLRHFFWNVSGRLEGLDTLHLEVWALGVHYNVVFRESADSGMISVTNPVNAAPRVTFDEPNGFQDTADTSFVIEMDLQDPNSDHLLVDLYWDDDRDRGNGMNRIVSGLLDQPTYTWDTRSLPDGWYWLHADVDDQRGGTNERTSKYPVIISHGNRVPYVELESPADESLVRDPEQLFKWRSFDDDGDTLYHDFYVGRDIDHMELVATTQETQVMYTPDDNAELMWTVLPRDGTVQGWCRDWYRSFTTDIEYPVEVELILPADGSTVAGPDVKLVWNGRDRDFQQVLYSVYLREGANTTRLVRDYDDPGGPVLIVLDLVPGTTYTWWVEGDNPFSVKGVSDRWTFTLAESGGPGVVLLGEALAGDTVTLDWGPDPSGTPPVSYDLHLVGHEHGDRIMLEGTTVTRHVLSGALLVEDSTYRWYVVARDASGTLGGSDPPYREFTYDTNAPPSVTVLEPEAHVGPGPHVLRWSASDPDGDDLLFDVYLDPQNATTLVRGDLVAFQHTVDLQGDRTYRWRVVPRDAHGSGEAAGGIVVVGPAGSDVPANGTLLGPVDGAEVEGPIVGLAWEAADLLGRELGFNLYIDTQGGDPLAAGAIPVAEGLSAKEWTVELEAGTTVRWAVTVRPLDGPETVLGNASFTVIEEDDALPVAVLSVGNGAPGIPATVTGLEVVSFNSNGSTAPGGGTLEYWFDFGDGFSSGWSYKPMTEHTYTEEGSYNVSLKVRDMRGSTSEPATVVVHVQGIDLGSSDSVPGAGAAATALALLATASLAGLVRRRDRQGGAW